MDKLWRILKEAVTLGGHDLSHVRRVYKMGLRLAEHYPETDMEILTAAIILHDIARSFEDNDPTHQIDHAQLGATQAEDILLKLGWPENRAAWVRACIAAHRYRDKENKPQTIEAKLLYDADKLDSTGLVGVARTYMLSGLYKEPLHVEMSAEQKKRGKDAKVHEFPQYSANIEYAIKLKYIPENLFTQEAKRIATIRLKKMEEFFEGLEYELDLLDF